MWWRQGRRGERAEWKGEGERGAVKKRERQGKEDGSSGKKRQKTKQKTIYVTVSKIKLDKT